MSEPARKPPASGGLDDDPFFYGSRWLTVHLPNGEAVLADGRKAAEAELARLRAELERLRNA